MMTSKIALTGIKPTGTPHLGNYVGAIRPALKLADQFDAYYFIANYHALNSMTDAALLRRYTHEVAATWLACGLDPDRVTFYRQSDVPETFELYAALANVTAKGLMNRAHAYKAKAARNSEEGRDTDDGVNMGLYNYPILMAADILLFSADVVPVGRDQVQHVEIARDLAESFNNTFGNVLRLPEVYLSATPSIAGLDGRKMSKSYQNTIPLFAADDTSLHKLIRKYKTDSTAANAPKDPETSGLFHLYRELSPPGETARVHGSLSAGSMSWGQLKDELFETLRASLEGPRATYRTLMSDTEQIEHILRKGADKARPQAAALVRRVRKAMGTD